MDINDIKDPYLKELYQKVKHASSTIEADAGDALEESSTEEELIVNWQSKLMELYHECQGFWGELEGMKQGRHKNTFCSCGAATEAGAKICTACGKTTQIRDVKCPGCGQTSTMGIGILPEDWQCPECGWMAS